MACINDSDQIYQEAQIPNRSSQVFHTLLKVVAWNVRTLCEAGKMEYVIRDMDRCGINILDLNEIRWVFKETKPI